jgi:hypothetical protein
LTTRAKGEKKPHAGSLRTKKAACGFSLSIECTDVFAVSYFRVGDYGVELMPQYFT